LSLHAALPIPPLPCKASSPPLPVKAVKRAGDLSARRCEGLTLRLGGDRDVQVETELGSTRASQLHVALGRCDARRLARGARAVALLEIDHESEDAVLDAALDVDHGENLAFFLGLRLCPLGRLTY